jgi:hypothetical protein
LLFLLVRLSTAKEVWQRSFPAAAVFRERKGTAMKSNAGMIVRVLKRLKAAVGYQELGMTRHALRCLDSLDSLGKIGPFGLIQEVLRGEFIKDRENHVSAAKALEIVSCMLPAPARQAITMTLAACYGQVNDMARAANVVASARGALPEAEATQANSAR